MNKENLVDWQPSISRHLVFIKFDVAGVCVKCSKKPLELGKDGSCTKCDANLCWDCWVKNNHKCCICNE